MPRSNTSYSLLRNSNRRKRRLSWSAVALLCLVLPTLLLTGPGWLGQWLLERVERRAAEKRVERIEAQNRQKPLTDIAPPQRSPRVSEDEAPQRRMAALEEQLRSRRGQFDSQEEFDNELGEEPPSMGEDSSLYEDGNPPTDGMRQRGEPVRLAKAPPVKLPSHLQGGRQVPRPTRVIHQPEFWPEPPDPFVKPAMQVDPRRHPEGH